jgi:uncharacterized protein
MKTSSYLRVLLLVFVLHTTDAAGDTSVQSARFIEAARKAALAATTYDPSYIRISPAKGDLPLSRGVCSDVLVRALREVGIDLQDLVYRDIQRRPEEYYRLQSGKTAPDRNIDHRRVTNLMVYFRGDTVHFTTIAPPDRDWQPGDIVIWNLAIDKRYHLVSSRFVPHIGVVSDKKGSSGEYMVIHHLPEAGREDDMLHGWAIIGHFRPILKD